jgi:ABC-2 type transport system ATP-binding protein
MIEAAGLTRTFGTTRALAGVDLSVGAGDVVGLLGPNGAGKSTTMRILAGALAATSGEVRVAGHDVLEDPLAVKRVVGFLPERPPVYADMVVADYLRHAAILRGVQDVGRAVDEVIDRTGLREVAHRLAGHLSKGFLQRVGLAQALVHAPAVLLLDEPSSGLDPAQRVEVRRLVRALADGEVTVVVSTHVLAEVEALCDRVVVLHEGRVVAQDDLAALAATRPLRLRVARPDGLEAALQALPEVARVDRVGDGAFEVVAPADATPAIARVAAAHDLLELGRAGGLEEIYLRATGSLA